MIEFGIRKSAPHHHGNRILKEYPSADSVNFQINQEHHHHHQKDTLRIKK